MNSSVRNKRKAAHGGFALLIAVIFMSVMLSFGLALGSLGYKQQVLASSSIRSQYAFYVADAALECALRADQRENAFSYATHDAENQPNAVFCGGTPATRLSYFYDADRLVVVDRLSLDSDTRCADVAVYKYASPQPPSNMTSYIFAQGYDVSCAVVDNPGTARYVSRGVSIQY